MYQLDSQRSVECLPPSHRRRRQWYGQWCQPDCLFWSTDSDLRWNRCWFRKSCGKTLLQPHPDWRRPWESEVKFATCICEAQDIRSIPIALNGRCDVVSSASIDKVEANTPDSINVAAALRSHLCLSARSQSVRLFLFWHVRHRYSGQESHFRHSTQRYRKDNVIFDARQNQSAISFSSVFVNKTGGFKVPSKIPNSVLSTDCSISIKSSNQVLSEASTSISQFVDARFPDETDFGSSLRMDMELEEGYGNPGQGLGKWCSRVTTPKILLVEEIKR